MGRRKVLGRFTFNYFDTTIKIVFATSAGCDINRLKTSYLNLQAMVGFRD
jgi:hypothetical protein